MRCLRERAYTMILDEIVVKTKERMEYEKGVASLQEMKDRAYAMDINTEFPFEKVLRLPGISFICEVKKASPSKGVIVEDFPFLQIAKDYEEAGARAISCLTEPFFFKGDNRYLQKISQEVSIPVLRKDFTIDPYMIYEAKVYGASAVLLICAILTDGELIEYLEIAHSLGLSALVEAHTKEEVDRAINCGAKIIGVNNRDLKTFKVDVTTSLSLRKNIPDEYVYVSESGISSNKQISKLVEAGTDAVLIGETLMLAADKRKMLDELRGTSDD